MAGFISHLPNTKEFALTQGILTLLGLFFPMILALFLLFKNKILLADLRSRFSLKSVPKRYIFLSIFTTFFALIIAQFISLLFGHGLEQFRIFSEPSFHSALFSAWLILVFAAIIEELAWHTYATDALMAKFSLFSTCVIFGFYWAIWHIPLSFIDGYYHSNVAQSGWVYSLNFLLSVFPFVILMNYFYIKSDRNILIAIFFHLFANVTNEIFATHPDSKVIQTALLFVLSIFIIIKEKELFFVKNRKNSKFTDMKMNAG